MAGTEVAVGEAYRTTLDSPWGDISAVLEIKSATGGMFVLNFPGRTAAAIAARVLADARTVVTEGLVRDCVGEIANVIAGQAKTLLTGTSHQLTFSLPRIIVGDHLGYRHERNNDCTVIVFRSDVGEFAMRLALE